MRALLVGTFPRHNIGNHFISMDLARWLPDVGVEVMTTSHHTRAWRRLPDMVATAWRSRTKVEVANVDVYSGRAFAGAEAVCWTLRRARVPYLLTLHGGNLPTFAREHPQRVRRMFEQAVVVNTPTGYLREQMAPYRDDLRRVPPPLELSHYPFRERVRPKPRLIWLRSFHELYEPTLAVEVLARLVPKVPEIELTMVGPDKGDGSLQATQALARELGVEEHIRYTGPLPKKEVPDALAQGDIFLNTPKVDNTPTCVLEAWACGLCVISTEVGGVPYLASSDRDALLVPAGDADAMAAAVERVLHEEGTAERLSRLGRKTAETYDRCSVMPRWKDLLQDVASSKKG